MSTNCSLDSCLCLNYVFKVVLERNVPAFLDYDEENLSRRRVGKQNHPKKVVMKYKPIFIEHETDQRATKRTTGLNLFLSRASQSFTLCTGSKEFFTLSSK